MSFGNTGITLFFFKLQMGYIYIHIYIHIYMYIYEYIDAYIDQCLS